MNAHAPVSCRNARRRPFVQFERIGEFDGYGSLTVRGLVHDLCRRDRRHLAGMQWLLGKIDAARSRARTSRSMPTMLRAYAYGVSRAPAARCRPARRAKDQPPTRGASRSASPMFLNISRRMRSPTRNTSSAPSCDGSTNTR
ncbi:hypothetical protein SAMN02787148_105270 [Burkholderia vietnamiensis]|nr:hypothetical protein EC918_10594 [Burkholderia vietnamiensis]SCZ26847.1 hypothetical protein SAMN02787148_105270 [Burkholderia vietnamiensis]SFX51904.1 hypothetical protein SAMN02787160_105270 [Burkholderia vietnamiensis]